MVQELFKDEDNVAFMWLCTVVWQGRETNDLARHPGGTEEELERRRIGVAIFLTKGLFRRPGAQPEFLIWEGSEGC
jgi:hypothetical protein